MTTRNAPRDRLLAIVDPRLAAAAYAIVLIVALLAPFDGYTPNDAVWAVDGGLAFQGKGIARSAVPPVKLYESLVHAGGLSVEVWAESAAIEQVGPARLVSYSLTTSVRNFTLGQRWGDLVVRLRTTETDVNGLRGSLVVEGVFDTPGARHIVLTYDGTEERVYVDGELRKHSRRLRGSFHNWDPEHLLVFGNEASALRPWRGRLGLVALYDRALAPHEVAANHRALSTPDAPRATEGLLALYRFTPRQGRVADESGLSPALDVEIPAFVQPFRPLFHTDREYLQGRLVEAEAREIVLNLLIFVPLGFLVGLAALSSGVGVSVAAAVTLATGLLLSLGVESLQYFLVSRYSELGDVMLNGLGTLVGLLLAFVAQPARALATRS